jgi:ATP-dependent RNA helicase RhlE
MPFAKLGLSKAVLQGVGAAGYTQPTPIQTEAIPAVLAGRDVLGTAQTGTGKTAAFILPILDRLQGKSGIRCLILTPTRELAAQIEANTRDYERYTPIKCAVVFGGVSMSPQIEALRRRPQILIATPGRLLDHLNRGNVRLDQIEILVLDEADRMLDMGFLPDIRRIMQRLPHQRQNLLFSATMPRPIEALARQTLKDPVAISIGPQITPVEGVTQTLYPVARHLKSALLLELFKRNGISSALVFTRTKRGAERLTHTLTRNGLPVTQLHGDRSQNQRTQALEGFRRGRYKIMVATDLAARGLDVEGISHVINYDVPETVEAYIHRIGRTARAQALGAAFTLVALEEEQNLHLIERGLKKSLPRVGLKGFNYSAEPQPRSHSHPTTHPQRRGRPMPRATARHR